MHLWLFDFLEFFEIEVFLVHSARLRQGTEHLLREGELPISGSPSENLVKLDQLIREKGLIVFQVILGVSNRCLLVRNFLAVDVIELFLGGSH